MKKGFTLVELVIVIIIVGILSIVAVPIYKNYVREAKLTEARSVATSIMQAMKLYELEYSVSTPASTFYYATSSVIPLLGIDLRNNKYYTYTNASFIWNGEHRVELSPRRYPQDPTYNLYYDSNYKPIYEHITDRSVDISNPEVIVNYF